MLSLARALATGFPRRLPGATRRLPAGMAANGFCKVSFDENIAPEALKQAAGAKEASFDRTSRKNLISQKFFETLDIFVIFRQGLFMLKTNTDQWSDYSHFGPKIIVKEHGGCYWYYVRTYGRKDILIENKGNALKITGKVEHAGEERDAHDDTVVMAEIFFPQGGYQYKRADYSIAWINNEVVVQLKEYPNKKQVVYFDK